jgi:hypothetical protein
VPIYLGRYWMMKDIEGLDDARVSVPAMVQHLYEDPCCGVHDEERSNGMLTLGGQHT